MCQWLNIVWNFIGNTTAHAQLDLAIAFLGNNPDKKRPEQLKAGNDASQFT